MFSAALYAHARTTSTIAHEIAGAARIRHSLRPLISRGRENNLQTSGASRREIVKARLFVIASAAKQSMSPHEERVDCFAALAMTNRAV
jgi:hypothetical protein